MLTIGAFSQCTGLTVKALRHYDELGLLVPASVDERNGYRRYSNRQIERAAAIGVLRGIGLPLARIGALLDDPAAVAAELERFDAERRAARAREDALLAEGRALLEGYATVAEPGERPAPAEPWVGFATSMRLDADDAEIEDGNAEFDRFFGLLHESGAEPRMRWWLHVDDLADDGAVRGQWRIPVGRRADAALLARLADAGFAPTSGELPERIERVVELGDDPALGDGFEAPHPGVIALARAGGDAVEPIRQVHRLGPDGVRIELVADLVG